MSDLTVERILNLIDGALEEGPCWRCEARPGAGGTGLCEPCRVWLVDPMAHGEPSRADVPAFTAAFMATVQDSYASACQK